MLDTSQFTMCIFNFNWLTLTCKIHFVKFHPEVASYSLSRGKKVYNPGDEVMTKILHFFFIKLAKLQGVWRQIFRFARIKTWTVILNKKYTTSAWALEYENVIGIRAFNFCCQCVFFLQYNDNCISYSHYSLFFSVYQYWYRMCHIINWVKVYWLGLSKPLDLTSHTKVSDSDIRCQNLN